MPRRRNSPFVRRFLHEQKENFFRRLFLVGPCIFLALVVNCCSLFFLPSIPGGIFSLKSSSAVQKSPFHFQPRSQPCSSKQNKERESTKAWYGCHTWPEALSEFSKANKDNEKIGCSRFWQVHGKNLKLDHFKVFNKEKSEGGQKETAERGRKVHPHKK